MVDFYWLALSKDVYKRQACTSSGLNRAGRAGRLGSTMAAGCCHAFSADGRCISLLKILYTNICAYD